jgi:hypothetical protein
LSLIEVGQGFGRARQKFPGAITHKHAGFLGQTKLSHVVQGYALSLTSDAGMMNEDID